MDGESDASNNFLLRGIEKKVFDCEWVCDYDSNEMLGLILA